MNGLQRQQYRDAQQAWLDRLASEHQWDYAITLQTNLRTYAVAAATRQQRVQAVERATHRFKMRLNRLLTGNGWRRNAAYTPNFISSIEGVGEREKTLHIHASVGNVGHKATEATRELLEEGVRQIWLATNVSVPLIPNLLTSPAVNVASANVKVVLIGRDAQQEHTAQRWLSYMTKEAGKGRWDVVDWQNAQAL